MNRSSSVLSALRFFRLSPNSLYVSLYRSFIMVFTSFTLFFLASLPFGCKACSPPLKRVVKVNTFASLIFGVWKLPRLPRNRSGTSPALGSRRRTCNCKVAEKLGSVYVLSAPPNPNKFRGGLQALHKEVARLQDS